MIPITKNIQVVDEQGNSYEATYPKRARGLVKHGRARFIEENVICLACPPSYMEDKTMTKVKEDKLIANETVSEITTDESVKVTADNEVKHATDNLTNSTNYTIDYVLKQIESIASQTDYLNKAITQLSKVTSGQTGETDVKEVSNSLCQIVMCRETTNQKLIAFYEKMYDDLKPTKMVKEQALEVMVHAFRNGACSEENLERMSDIMDMIRHM